MFMEHSDKLLEAVINNTISGICIFSITDEREILPVYLNEGFFRMLGYTQSEMQKIIKNLRKMILPEDLAVFDQGIDDVLKDDGAAEFEFRTVTGGGDIRWLQVRGNLYGRVEGYLVAGAVIIDATERKSIEEEMALQAERINILSKIVVEHFIDYNSRTDVLNIKINKQAYKKDEIVIKDFVAKSDFTNIHSEDREKLSDIIHHARLHVSSEIFEFRSNFFEDDPERKQEFLWYRATITSVKGADGYVSRIVGRVVNIDKEKRKELELKSRADTDALTGLLNKTTTAQLIREVLAKQEKEGIKSALMILDLDNFKAVNDTFGHSVGDMVVAESGRVLKDTFKGRDIIGRVGGDEFMVLMVDIKSENDPMEIAKLINRLLTKTIADSTGKVTITVSIGITMCYGSLTPFEDYYKQADKALYKTKNDGRNGRTLYSKDM